MSCATKADLLQELRRPNSVAAQGGNAVSDSDSDQTDSQDASAGKAQHDRGRPTVEDVELIEVRNMLAQKATIEMSMLLSNVRRWPQLVCACLCVCKSHIKLIFTKSPYLASLLPLCLLQNSYGTLPVPA